MKVLFADFSTPEQHTEKEKKAIVLAGNPHRRWWDVVIEQLINSAIVAGIATLSAGWIDPWVGLKAFGLTFLIEMRKYRKL